jgi:hypothetical protein
MVFKKIQLERRKEKVILEDCRNEAKGWIEWSGRRDSKAPSRVSTMPFSLLNLTPKLLNRKRLLDFSSTPFPALFSHQWTVFRDNLVSLVSPKFATND